MRPLLLALLGAVFAAPSAASTDQAWAAIDQAATKACKGDVITRYSGGDPLTISIVGRVAGVGGYNGDAYYAVIVEVGKVGAHAAANRSVCLYDKRAIRVTAGMVSTSAP